MEKITKPMEDFLEALLILEEKGEPLESVRVAQILGISKPAVHQMGHELIKRGLINRDDYGPLSLTEKGRNAGMVVYRRHKIIKAFLMSLGVSEATANKDCCLLEHDVSEETLLALERELNKK